MRIATFNINGVNRRLKNLLGWLDREAPDVVCLQELKTADEQLPRLAVERAGYGGVWLGQRSWNGVAILARGTEPVLVQKALPGDPADTQSRYLEAAVNGVLVACLYLPNGNPQPGPKFAYKLAWFERLFRRAHELSHSGHPVVLAGDFNVVPTDCDIYDPKSWTKNALLQPASRAAYQRLLDDGWMDAIRAQHATERIYTFWDYFRKHWPRNAGLRLDHLLLNATLAPRLRASGVDTWVRAEEDASDHAPAWIELGAASRSTRRKRREATARPPKADAGRRRARRQDTCDPRSPAPR